MAYDFEENLSKDEKTYNVGGSNDEYFEITPGNDNVCRVLTPGAVRPQHFFGKGVKPKMCYGYDKGCPIREKDSKYDHAQPSIKYMMYVIDRKDNVIKTAEFSYSIVKQIAILQHNPDYEFEDLPMPYDIRITKKGEGMNTEYKVDVKPNGADVTEEQQAILVEKMLGNSPEQIVDKMKQKQIEADEADGSRLSAKQLEDEKRERMDKFKKDVVSSPKQDAEPGYDYPENTDEVAF